MTLYRWAWVLVAVSALGPFLLLEVVGQVFAWEAALVCKRGRESEPEGEGKRGRNSLNSRYTNLVGDWCVMLNTAGTLARILLVADLERRPLSRGSAVMSSFLIISGASRPADILALTLVSVYSLTRPGSSAAASPALRTPLREKGKMEKSEG